MRQRTTLISSALLKAEVSEPAPDIPWSHAAGGRIDDGLSDMDEVLMAGAGWHELQHQQALP